MANREHFRRQTAYSLVLLFILGTASQKSDMLFFLKFLKLKSLLDVLARVFALNSTVHHSQTQKFQTTEKFIQNNDPHLTLDFK